MDINFLKLHCAGNDFVVLDGYTTPHPMSSYIAAQLGHRRFGVGADQVLWIGPSQVPDADFHYRIFNGDGTEAEMCGNGARAVATYARLRGLTDKESIKFQVVRGIVTVFFTDGLASVNIGRPDFSAQAVDFDGSGFVKQVNQAFLYEAQYEGQRYTFSTVSVGNPHAIVLLKDQDDVLAVAERVGPFFEKNPMFKYGANISFMHVQSPHEIKAVTYERNCGITLSCGTGASSIYAVAKQLGLVDGKADIHFPGGTLKVWQNENEELFVSGKVTTVFNGQMTLDDQ